jgi:hypothetical protein
MAAATEARYAKCSNCKHWDKADEHNGDCRRYPPRIIEALIGAPDEGFDVTAISFFPGTNDHEVCGEWVSICRDRELSQ